MLKYYFIFEREGRTVLCDVEAENLPDALAEAKRLEPDGKLEDFYGGDVTVCLDCEYKDSEHCFDTVEGRRCPKCGSPKVRQT